MDASSRIGDQTTSDVVVRLRTQEGRDERIYCHSRILVEKSTYFAERLSESWPTCQILNSRNCVEVYCQESDFDHHINVLRLLYVFVDDSVDDLWIGVKNALCILRVAIGLGCAQIVSACVNYLEAVPWEESEEEEILKTISGMGSQVEPILARLRPVNPSAMREVFISTLQFATSSPPSLMNDLKASAQEQLEYMVTEDEDTPLLLATDDLKSDVKDCVRKLFSRFNILLEAFSNGPMESVGDDGKIKLFQSYLADFSWACQLLTKLEIMREFVNSWVDSSDKIVKVIQSSAMGETIETKLKVVEVVAKVLESIGYGTVILATAKRLHMVKVWLPFVRVTKPVIDSAMTKDEDCLTFKVDNELWPSLESTFVSLVLALPSAEQADILTEWLGNEYIQYPDLTEAFEIWCYRSKVAKRRLASLGDPLYD